MTIQNIVQNPGVLDDRISPNVTVIICAVIEINPRIVVITNRFSMVDICIIDQVRFAISCLNHNLFTIWLQEHINYFCTVTVEIDMGAPPDQVVGAEAGQEEERICE